MKPEITDGTGSYTFEWKDDQIRIRVSRMHLHHDGKATAEVLITTTNKDYKSPFLHQSQVNLSSAATMEKLEKLLSTRYPKANWVSIIEATAYNTLERLRQGEPMLELHTQQEVTKPNYLVFPILPLNQPTVIFGEKGVCKSEIALLLSISVALPWHDNPLGLITQRESAIPLICDWETDKNEALWRLKCLQEGMNLSYISIPYRRCAMPLSRDIEAIQQAISDANATFIVIDSLAGAAGGDLNKSEIATEFFAALRQLKVTSLVIAQTSKDRENKNKSVLGSGIFTYYFRSIWELRKEQGEGEDDIDIGMFHLAANMSRLYHPLGFHFSFSEDRTTVATQDTRSIAGLLERSSNTTRVYELLKDGALSTKDIVEELGIARNIADATIKRMRDRGIIVRVEDKWGLVYE